MSETGITQLAEPEENHCRSVLGSWALHMLKEVGLISEGYSVSNNTPLQKKFSGRKLNEMADTCSVGRS